jgi:hypothetical protein
MPMYFRTRKLPATDTKGARIRVTRESDKAYQDFGYDYSTSDPHKTALVEFIRERHSNMAEYDIEVLRETATGYAYRIDDLT